MECNKDEAMRAKEIAEKKMQNNDFDGARKTALKAQQLFPELENITQLLAVCNVHCAAQSRILGSEKDWYNILQVERLVDEPTIRKQYRKLALVLHPDKNKFPGAESAFKIIGEAHMVLSDHGKRSLFDSKIGIALKSARARPPSHHVNINPSARKQFPVQNNTANGFSSQFSGLNHHQTTQGKSTADKESFWTCCPFCNIKYQFYKEVQNRILRCQRCSKPYVAHDIASQGVFQGLNQSQAASSGVFPRFNQNQAAARAVPPAFNWNKPAVAEPKKDPIQRPYRTCGEKTGGSTAFNIGSQGNTSCGSVGSVSGTEMRTAAKVDLGNKTKASRKEDDAMPKDVKMADGEAGLRNKPRKRGRKLESESSESFESSSTSDIEDIAIKESGSDPAPGFASGVDASDIVRRSSRQKYKVLYNEIGSDDDDFESPPKRPREGKSSSDGDVRQETIINDNIKFANPMKQEENIPSPGASATRKTKSCKTQSSVPATAAPKRDSEKVEIVDVSESDDDRCPEFFDTPDPEFHDFDKFKEESCFAVDQFWACYDSVDGMPRFYAQIKKVYSTGSKLRITWLEPDPGNLDEINWVNEGLPVGCGKFKRGSPEVVERPILSHKLVCEKGRGRGSFTVYPRKGETWALFKDWDIKWSTDADNHKQYKYEIVEVVSDFKESVGVEVVFLEKLNGFVSLFRERSQNRAKSMLVPPTEMLRFSHRILSFKMSGTEKGVPEGCLELDPLSLPANPDDICYPFVAQVDIKNLSAEASCSNQESSQLNKSKSSEIENTPRKPADFVREIGIGGETCKLRRSPRGLNIVDKENRHANACDPSSRMETSNHLNGRESERCSEFSPSNIDVSTCQVDKKIDVQKLEASLSKSNSIHQSLSPGRRVSEEQFHDFKEDRSEGKFETGQIWALYVPEDKLPKLYGQIKRIGHSPFRLYVAPLEAVKAPKNGGQPVCGIFKVTKGKPRAFEPCSFSHLLKANLDRKNNFEIFPKVGEVWALYRNWNSELTSSELKNCEYQLVEIIGISPNCTTVSPLAPLAPRCYERVLRSPRKKLSGFETIDLQENELGRFSHQIPAFLLTTDVDGSFAGSWLVDPAAVPGKLTQGKKAS